MGETEKWKRNLVMSERKIDTQALTVDQLLRFDELRRREIVRSTNNPVSDYCGTI